MGIQRDPERNEIKFLDQFAGFTDTHRVLEVGCGDGRLTWHYARKVSRVAGIEIQRDNLRIAILERPHDLDDRVVFANADSLDLPFAKETFDLAILSWSL